MIDDFGDELPFEELDPCCQKEVLERKHYNEVSKKLRRTDQSQIRLDLRNKTFSNVWKDSNCICCTKGLTDYYLLAQLKQQQQLEYDELILKNDKLNESNDSQLSDNDSDLDDSEFISEFEIEQRLKFEEYQETLKKAKTYGFGIHVEDTIDHIIYEILLGTYYFDNYLIIYNK